MPLLTPHPDCARSAIALDISAQVDRPAGDRLIVEYNIGGPLDDVVIPAALEPGLGKDLWKHTCLELFVGVSGSQAYHEFNFSPSGLWAVYSFTGYRDPKSLEDSAPVPELSWERSERQLRLTASINLSGMEPAHEKASLELAPTAVIEATDGTLSYWALRHADGAPDFHQRAGFDLRVEAGPAA